MFEMVRAYAKENQGKTSLTEIRFTNFDDRTVDIFEKECNQVGGTKA